MSKIFIANWKMRLDYKASIKEAKAFARSFVNAKERVVLCPDFSVLGEVREIIKRAKISLGAQNCSAYISGAYTGEMSARNLKQLGVEYVIIGHSERRTYFQETDDLINKKVLAAISAKLKPILCVGETAAEKKKKLTKTVIKRQLKAGLKNVSASLIIAYEPVWAIGSGQIIKADEAQEIHAYIKREAGQILKKDVKVIYGGSVNASQAPAFSGLKDIDGFLVGGASLKAADFYNICKI